VKNEEVLNTVKENRNGLHIIKRKKAKWIGHILHRDCLLKHLTEGKIKGRKDEEEDVGSFFDVHGTVHRDIFL